MHAIPIITASMSHLDPTMRAIDACVSRLRSLGIDQWDDQYPGNEVISAAIDKRSLFVVVESGLVAAAVGLDAEQPLEYLSCSWRFDLPALIVHHLVVHPDRWRNGYATRLMDFSEEYASSRGFGSVRLDAYAGNQAALSLYQARGYSQAGEVAFPRRSLAFRCFEKQVHQRVVSESFMRSP